MIASREEMWIQLLWLVTLINQKVSCTKCSIFIKAKFTKCGKIIHYLYGALDGTRKKYSLNKGISLKVVTVYWDFTVTHFSRAREGTQTGLQKYAWPCDMSKLREDSGKYILNLPLIIIKYSWKMIYCHACGPETTLKNALLWSLLLRLYDYFLNTSK
jgi:hypothetical protein